MVMRDDAKTVRCSDSLLQGLDSRLFELRDAATTHAHQMIVVLFVVGDLVEPTAIAKPPLVDKTSVDHQLDGAIHRRVADRVLLAPSSDQQLVKRDVPSLRSERLGDRTSLVRKTKPPLNDFLPKSLNEGRLAHARNGATQPRQCPPRPQRQPLQSTE